MTTEIIEKALKDLANESREANNSFLGLQELVKSVFAKMYQFENHLTNTISQQGNFEKILLEITKEWKREREEYKQIFTEQQEKFEQMHRELLKELRQQKEEHKAAIGQLQDNFGKWLEGKQLIAPAVDMNPLAQKVAKGICNMNALVKEGMASMNGSVNAAVVDGFSRVNQVVEAQPKAIVRQWRLVFYPEDDHNGNYRYLMRGIMITSVALVIAFFLFSLGAMAVKTHAYSGPGTESKGKFHKLTFQDLEDSITLFENQVKHQQKVRKQLSR